MVNLGVGVGVGESCSSSFDSIWGSGCGWGSFHSHPLCLSALTLSLVLPLLLLQRLCPRLRPEWLIKRESERIIIVIVCWFDCLSAFVFYFFKFLIFYLQRKEQRRAYVRYVPILSCFSDSSRDYPFAE